MITNEVMNLDQLALHLQMSRASVYHLVADGKIPGAKVGKQWRFSRPVIDRWLEGDGQRRASTLVVEDDSLIRDLVTRAIREAGHHATGVESVAEALTLLQEVQFDVVFLDLLLPDGTGLDVVNAARRLALPPEIILVTGHPEHELIDEVRSVLPYITVLNKPVRIKVLLELTSRAVANKAVSQSNE